MMADPNLKREAKGIVEQIREMIVDPNLQNRTKRAAEQMEAMKALPNLHEQTKLFAELMEALKADPKFQSEAQHIAEQMRAMIIDPNLQKQAKHIAEQVEAMMANPHIHDMAKWFTEQMEGMKTAPVQGSKVNLLGKSFDRALGAPRQQAELDRTTLGKQEYLAPTSLAQAQEHLDNIQNTDLDSTTLGKSGHLAMPRGTPLKQAQSLSAPSSLLMRGMFRPLMRGRYRPPTIKKPIPSVGFIPRLPHLRRGHRMSPAHQARAPFD